MKFRFAAALMLGLAMLGGISACSYTRPLTVLPGDITTATKEGRGTCATILGMFRSGDCSVNTIANSAGIHEVLVVDVVETAYAAFYISSEVIVRGK